MMTRLGLHLANAGAAPWWPANALYAADFVNNRYMRNGVAIARAEAFTFSRNSPKLAQDSTGTWRSFGPNEPAITDRGLLLEPAATNMIPNSSMVGAALGVVGAGGSLPTGWSSQNYDIVTVTGLGTEAGLPFIELRLQASNAGAGIRYALINLHPIPVPALLGETWTVSCFFRHVAGAWHPDPASTLVLTIAEAGTTTVYPSNSLPPDEMAALTRQSFTWKTTRAGPINLSMRAAQTALQNGGSIDITLRIMVPALVKEAALSSPILTDNLALTREQDGLMLNLPASTTSLRVLTPTTTITMAPNAGIYDPAMEVLSVTGFAFALP